MERHDIEVAGLVDNTGRLKMYMGEFREFCARHKGARVVVRFTAYPVGTSEALKGYYYKCVVPSMRSGFAETGELMTEEETERRLREMCPVCVEETEEGGRYSARVMEIDELGTGRLCDFVEWVKVFAAENMNIYIEDPKII